jgi:hypothetical protein
LERQTDQPQWQPDAIRLAPQQIRSDRMHRHPVEPLIDGRKQTGHFNIRSLAQHVQCPRAVLAAAPRKQDSFSQSPHQKLSSKTVCIELPRAPTAPVGAVYRY